MRVHEEVVIVVGAPPERVGDAVRLFPEATVVATPTLDAAVRWLEEAAHAASVHAMPLSADGLEIDVDDHRVMFNGAALHLTEQEIRLLGCLASEPGHARTYEELFVDGWGQHYLQDPGPVQAAVKRLRHKLESVGAEVRLEAVRGVGFRLSTVDPSEGSSLA